MTSKRDQASHGYGMQSLRMLTETYEGALQMNSGDGLFRLSIPLPIPAGERAAG